jgi:hypothetical protein
MFVVIVVATAENTLLIAMATEPMPLTEPKVIIVVTRAYSTRSCPSSRTRRLPRKAPFGLREIPFERRHIDSRTFGEKQRILMKV